MKQKKTHIPKINVSFTPHRCMKSRTYVNSSSEVFDILMKIWDMNTILLYEEFIVLYLDRRNGIIGWRRIGQGNCSGVVVNIQLIFGIAVQASVSSLIIAHNHPSTKTNPSEQDKKITNKIRDGCELFDMKLLDHLIVTTGSYYSFADEGDIWIEPAGLSCGLSL